MLDIIQNYLFWTTAITLGVLAIICVFELRINKENRRISNFLSKNSGIVLLITALLISIISFDEYGISWDETIQRKTGRISFEYLYSNNQELLEWKDRDYGVAVELPLYIIERIFNLTDKRSIYLTRHFLTHLFYLTGLYFGYMLIELLYRKRSLAVIGIFLIMLHPRIYSHSFFNTKDIPFMTLFMICLYLNAVAFRDKRNLQYIFLGVGVGLMINLRMMGILLFFIIIGLLIIDLIQEKNYKIEIRLGIIFIIATLVTLYISWPFLWKNPIGNFSYAFSNISNARYIGKVLFNGQLILPKDLKWDYIPRWFLMTTPISYLLVGLIGSVLVIVDLFRSPTDYFSNSPKRNNLVFLVCFILPVIIIIITKPILYDGWRHLYFIYPGFVLLSLVGINYLLEKGMGKLIISVLCINFSIIGLFMIKNFPLQYIYFNEFVDTSSSEYLRSQYDLDYWGISYKQSLEYILEHDSSETIDIAVGGAVGNYNSFILTAAERNRINFVDKEKAMYYTTNFRGQPDEVVGSEYELWHSNRIGNNTVYAIYKKK